MGVQVKKGICRTVFSLEYLRNHVKEHKDNIFYYESGEIADPLEKNTVHGLVKTLQDTNPSVTKDVLESCLEQPLPESASYDYRTEVPAKARSLDSDEERILIGLSRTGGIRSGGGAGDSPQVDARIRIKTSDGTPLYTVFIEAKVRGADLRRGQLEDYVEAFDIREQDTEGAPWSTIQWSDIYRIFEKNRNPFSTGTEPLRDEYLLKEFNSRLLQKGMVRGTLGVSKSDGKDGEKHRKRLLVGPKDPDGEPVLTFWAFSRRNGQNQSSSMEVPQHCLQDLFGQMDFDTRREVFIEGDLMALREWVIKTTDLTESDFKSDGSTFARAEREEYRDPAGILLRFSSTNHFKINTYNVEKSNGWIYYPPILVPHEWESVFTELSEKLSKNQRRRFIENFDLDALWEAYLNS